jgi:peptidylprolyl isomerase
MTRRPLTFFLAAVAILLAPGCRQVRQTTSPQAEATESGLQITITRQGTGELVQAGDFVKIHYTAMLADGSVFDDSRERGAPATIRLDNGQVIPGLAEGITMLRPGAQATLIIPPSLAYGDKGYGPVPPNATLTYQVEVLERMAPPESLAVEGLERRETESGLAYTIVKEGDGQRLMSGMEVQVHYTGYLEDGTVFDSSRDRGQPIAFVLGRKMVIPGWEEAFSLLRVGDQARLFIPYSLAYGTAGRGRIPGRADLVFDVEVIGASQSDVPRPYDTEQAQVITTESGLQVMVIQEGTGELPAEGDMITVHYSGFLSDGSLFDSSRQRGEPIRFVLGKRQVIPGWDEGFALLKKGSRARLIIPPELGYGPEGRGPIPPNSTLVFDVEVLDIE